MKHKKSLLALATFGIFAGVGLATTANVSAFTDYFIGEDTYREGENNMYYIDANKIDIECPSGAAAYKVDKDYDASKLTWFRADVTCTNISFDLNGKTVADGAITIPGGVTITLEDSVGGGSLQNSASRNHAFVDSIVNAQGYGDGAISKVIIKSGQYQGGFRGNGRSLAVDIEGGAFEDSNWDSTVNVAYTIQAGTFNNIMLVHNSDYGGQISILGGTFNNPTFSVRALSENGSTIGSISIRGGVFNNPTMDDSSKLLNLAISGGTFSERPDEKYVANGFAVYDIDGKYIVMHEFSMIDFWQYMYVGQVNTWATVSPKSVSETFKITSSDEAIVSIECKDRPEDDPMYAMLKGCTITAKKPGKATVSYTTDYGFNGEFVIYVAEVDATSFGDAAEEAKNYLSKTISCLNSDRAKPLGCSGVFGGEVDKTVADNDKVIAAIKENHKLNLNLTEKEVTLDKDEEKAIKDTAFYSTDGQELSMADTNVAAAYTLSSDVFDTTSNKTIIEGWSFNMVKKLPLPKILQGRNRKIQIVTLIKMADGKYDTFAREAFAEDGYVHLANEGRIGGSNGKFVIVYDGSVINPDGTTDDVPAVPKTGHEEDLSKEGKSIFMILGASAAILLVAFAITAYGIHRKKAINKVRF